MFGPNADTSTIKPVEKSKPFEGAFRRVSLPLGRKAGVTTHEMPAIILNQKTNEKEKIEKTVEVLSVKKKKKIPPGRLKRAASKGELPAQSSLVPKETPEEKLRRFRENGVHEVQKTKRRHRLRDIFKQENKHQTLDSLKGFFNFTVWKDALAKSEQEVRDSILKHHILSHRLKFDSKTPEFFAIGIERLADEIIKKICEHLLTEPKECLSVLFSTYTAGKEPPKCLVALKDSATLEEFIENAENIPNEEPEKDIILWTFGAYKVLETMKNWLTDEKKNEVKFSLYQAFAFKSETHLKAVNSPRIKRNRTKSLTRSTARDAFITTSGKSKQEEHPKVKQRNDTVAPLRKSKVKSKKGEKETVELEDDPKDSPMAWFVSHLKHAALGSSKRDTINKLESASVEDWEYALAKNEAIFVTEQIFFYHRNELAETLNIEQFAKLIEEITEKVVSEWLAFPKSLLQAFADGHEKKENIPCGLSAFLNVESLQEFLDIYNGLEEGEDKEILYLAMGGKKVFGKLQERLNEVGLNQIRIQILNTLVDVAYLKQNSSQISFPKTFSTASLTNNTAIRWLLPEGSSSTNIDKVYVNDKRIKFLSSDENRNACRASNLKLFIDAMNPHDSFDIEVAKNVLSNQTINEPCKINELFLQGIELTKPFTDPLYELIKKTGFSIKSKRMKGGLGTVVKFFPTYSEKPKDNDGKETVPVLEHTRVENTWYWDLYRNQMIVGACRFILNYIVDKDYKNGTVLSASFEGFHFGVDQPAEFKFLANLK